MTVFHFPVAGSWQDIVVYLIPVDRIVPSDWNPNHMPDETFRELADEILREGFDHPIVVVPLGDRFRLVSGEHRWKAAKATGLQEIPAIIKTDWDEKMEKIETVRRNLLTGKLDDQRFAALVNSLRAEHDIPVSVLSQEMGFRSTAEFQSHYQKELTQKKKQQEAVVEEVQSGPEQTLENLTTFVAEVVQTYGDTAGEGLVGFYHRGKPAFLVSCTPELKRALVALLAKTKQTKQDPRQALAEALLKMVGE